MILSLASFIINNLITLLFWRTKSLVPSTSPTLRFSYTIEVLTGRRGRDCMIVRITTIYAISAFHHWRCEFESRSSEVCSIQRYVIKFVSDLQQVSGFLWVLRFPPPITLSATI
jgi:hypothetical protein